jgi:predicted HicB family RNase H-like nuclease
MSEEKFKQVKVPAEVHAKVAALADKEGRILQKFIGQLLIEAVKIREEQSKQASGAAA